MYFISIQDFPPSVTIIDNKCLDKLLEKPSFPASKTGFSMRAFTYVRVSVVVCVFKPLYTFVGGWLSGGKPQDWHSLRNMRAE